MMLFNSIPIKMMPATIFILINFVLVARYNIHMFQLNGYKPKEHFDWIRQHFINQVFMVFVFTVGMYHIKPDNFFVEVFMELCLYSVMIMTFLIYNRYRVEKVKKKLVYTARVKRLIATMTFINLCVVVPVLISDYRNIDGALMILMAFQFLILIFAAYMNTPMEKAINKHYINDAKRILNEHPNLTIIGVTGSFGKTSVKFYLHTLLSEKYNVLATPESYNTPMGIVKTIRGDLKPTDEIFICEMGARHVGDIKEICDIVHPHYGVITALGPQHIETFFHIENIKKTKFELADSLPEDGMLFLNNDNDAIRLNAVNYNNTIMYGCKENPNGYRARLLSTSIHGSEFEVITPTGEKQTYQMKLIGEHNIVNVCGAIAVANSLGIALKDLRVPVRRLTPVEHRMQIIDHGSYTIIDDAFNSNPVGSKAALETLSQFDGIKIMITPGMVELGSQEEDLNRRFGNYAADACDYILLVGAKRTEPIKKGAFQRNFPQSRLKTFYKFEEAFDYALQIEGEGHKYILLENDLPDNY